MINAGRLAGTILCCFSSFGRSRKPNRWENFTWFILAWMKRLLFLPILLLTSCSKQGTAPSPTAELPHATVVMRDGTRVSGGVASSTPTEITINPDAGGSRTIPMKDVRRVDYGETATTAKPAPPATAPAATPAPGDAPPPPEPTHDEHEHAS